MRITEFIPIEFRRRCDSVDIADQVGFGPEKRLIAGFACEPGKNAPIWNDPHFFGARLETGWTKLFTLMYRQIRELRSAGGANT